MKSATIPVILVALLLPRLSDAQVKGPIVAVFDMENKGSGLAPEVLGRLTDFLTNRVNAP